MDAMQTLERLAERARRENPPHIDVSQKVIQSLRTRDAGREEGPFSGPLFRFSAISFASALIVGAFALESWLSMHDPMVHLFDTVAMVMK
jgi:hypothetical protein